jgi:flavin-dependent dehydrogenase
VRVAIAGAGMSGSYLASLLARMGQVVDLYEATKTRYTRCGISPCAWMVPIRGFSLLVEAVGLEARKYVLSKIPEMGFNRQIFATDLCTIDKPSLLRDLRGHDREVKQCVLDPASYDRIIDATGVARAYLPPTENDTVIPTVQYLTESAQESNTAEIVLVALGYAWRFPLGKGMWHVGCGSLSNSPEEELAKTGLLRSPSITVCKCPKSSVRLTGPEHSKPYVNGKVWGVGEAVGCVSPIIGEGIVPAMQCSQILVENWNDPERYTSRVNLRLGWVNREARLLQKIIHENSFSLSDGLTITRNSSRIGMKLSAKNALSFIRLIKKGVYNGTRTTDNF